MEKENTTIATEVLRLLKEENEKSENKSRQAIKRIYLLLIIKIKNPHGLQRSCRAAHGDFFKVESRKSKVESRFAAQSR